MHGASRSWLQAAIIGAVAVSLSGFGLVAPATAQEQEEKRQEEEEEAFEPAVQTEAMDLVEVIEENGSLSTFAALLEASGVKQELENRDEEYTILAPHNAAFADVSEQAITTRGADWAREIVLQHIIRGEYTLKDLQGEGDLTTLNRTEELTALGVESREGEVLVGEARIVEGDIRASNGVVHVIDKVLFPAKEPLKEPLKEPKEPEEPPEKP